MGKIPRQSKKTSTPKNNDEINFISLPDLKCSFFLVEDKASKSKDNVKFMVKLEEGRYKNVVVQMENFVIVNDKTISFDYSLIQNPNPDLNMEHLNRMVKLVAKKILTLASKNAMSMMESNDRTVNSKESN